jgi:hypothetical protein
VTQPRNTEKYNNILVLLQDLDPWTAKYVEWLGGISIFNFLYYRCWARSYALSTTNKNNCKIQFFNANLIMYRMIEETSEAEFERLLNQLRDATQEQPDPEGAAEGAAEGEDEALLDVDNNDDVVYLRWSRRRHQTHRKRQPLLTQQKR